MEIVGLNVISWTSEREDGKRKKGYIYIYIERERERRWFQQEKDNKKKYWYIKNTFMLKIQTKFE